MKSGRIPEIALLFGAGNEAEYAQGIGKIGYANGVS
jgi:hypothetical protein